MIRKKKKTLANKDIRTGRFAHNQYVDRRSILDQVYSDSLISQSPFRGLLRFILIIGVLYVINHTLVSTNILFNPSIVPTSNLRQANYYDKLLSNGRSSFDLFVFLDFLCPLYAHVTKKSFINLKFTVPFSCTNSSSREHL